LLLELRPSKRGLPYNQAQQQVSAAGGGGGGLNRLGIAAPVSGQVISRSVVLGQTVAADAELIASPTFQRFAVNHLQPADAESG
jgi:cobalt-zinc-cadmium efflux system membrane fusion protein